MVCAGQKILLGGVSCLQGSEKGLPTRNDHCSTHKYALGQPKRRRRTVKAMVAGQSHGGSNDVLLWD